MAGAQLISWYLAGVARRLEGEAVDRERLIEELTAHLDDTIARNIASGMPEQHAVQEAMRSCGSGDDIVTAVRQNDERGASTMVLSRWTGAAGLAAVPMAVVGTVWWSWYAAMLAMALVAVGVIGLLADHWRLARTHVAGALALFAAGMVSAGTATVGQDTLLRAVGVPASFVLAAVVVVSVGLLRARLVPRGAVFLMVAGLAILLGLNTLGYVNGNEPPYLAGVGGITAVAGWIWLHATTMVRGHGPRPAAA